MKYGRLKTMMSYSKYISVLERHKENVFICLRADGRPAHLPVGFWGVGVLEESDLGFTQCVGCETHL